MNGHPPDPSHADVPGGRARPPRPANDVAPYDGLAAITTGNLRHCRVPSPGSPSGGRTRRPADLLAARPVPSPAPAPVVPGPWLRRGSFSDPMRTSGPLSTHNRASGQRRAVRRPDPVRGLQLLARVREVNAGRMWRGLLATPHAPSIYPHDTRRRYSRHKPQPRSL